jgi:hypothetical protein
VEPFLQRFDAMDVDKSGHLSFEDIEQLADDMAKRQNSKPHCQSSGTLPHSTSLAKVTEDTDEEHGTLDHNDAHTLHANASAEPDSYHYASSPEPKMKELKALVTSTRPNPSQTISEPKVNQLEALILERDLRIQTLQSELEIARSNRTTSSILPAPPQTIVVSI